MPSAVERVGQAISDGKRNTKRRIDGLTMRDVRARTICPNDTLLFVEYKRAVRLVARAPKDNSNEIVFYLSIVKSDSSN